MTNVINFNGQKVSSAFAHLKVNKGLGDGVTAGGFPILNIRGKVWSLKYQGQIHKFLRPDDGTALTYLDIVILDAAETTSQIYFAEWNGEDSSDGPLCASIRGDVPDPGVSEPQNKTCAGCRRNVWITKPSGQRGKDCQTHKRLAVLLMPTMTTKMLGAPLLEPVYLKVPPGSLGQLKAYGDKLAHAGLPFAAVLTRVSFDPGRLFQINFDFRQTLADKEAPLVLPLIDDPRTRRIIGEVPVLREVIAKPVEPTRVETGLMEAFGPVADPEPLPVPQRARAVEPEIIPPPPQKKRGRPAKVSVQEVVENGEDEPELPMENGGGEGDDSDDMHQKVKDLLDRRMDDILK